jgi:hypothetical protein
MVIFTQKHARHSTAGQVAAGFTPGGNLALTTIGQTVY